MKIYNKNGVEILDVNVSDESYRYRTIMGDNSITLMFTMFEYIEIEIDSYIDYQGERYTLRKPQIPVMNDTENFDYTALFESAGSLLSKYKFRDYSNRLKFSMTGKPLDFIQAVIHNLNLRDSGWIVGTCIDAVEKTLSFNHTYIKDVLRQVAEAFKTEFEIIGKQINLKKLEYNKSNPLSLSYGRGNGFKSGVKRDNVGNSKAFEILFVQGGEKNINTSEYGSPELLLPKSQALKYDGSKFEGEEGYISQNAREYISDNLGLSIQRNKTLSTKVEDSVDLSNIYPSRIGSVSTVVVVNADKNYYDITDSSIPDALDYDDCLIAGETMTIIFQSGMLAGREFDCNYNHSARKFEIVPAELDGIAMPGGVYVPTVGDKYAIFGIQLPEAYFCDNVTKTGASWELFKEAVKYFYDNEDEKFSFTGVLDPIWASYDWVNIGGKIILGGFISFTAEFQQTPALIRITGVKDFINFPHKPEIELSNVTSGGGYGSSIKDIPNTETVIQESKKEVVRFAKRGFRDAQETAKMIQDSLLNFTGSISPITVQTMQLLVGDESLQFEFVENSSSTASIPHAETYNPTTKQFSSAAGVLQHKSLGITTISSSHTASEYKWWAMSAFISAVLDEADKSYYLYAKCSKTANTGVFLLSETAIAIEQVAGYYHLLVGILNAERDSDRSYSPLYGYSELTPGRLTTKKIVSPSGNVYFDLDTGNGDGEIAGNIKFRSTGGTLKDIPTALTETQTAAAEDATSKVNAVQVGGNNLLSNSLGMYGFVAQNGVIVDINQPDPIGGNSATLLALHSGKWDFYRRVDGLTAGKQYTFSVWIKLGTASNFVVTPNNTIAWNTLNAQVQVSGGTGWQRLICVFTAYGTGAVNLHIGGNLESLVQGDGTVYVYGWRLVEGNEDIQSQIAETNDYLNAIQADLQAQIDGQVISWFQEYDPFTTNYPASLWTTDEEKNRHANDTFTNTLTGWSWRWAMVSGNWGWVWISDTATAKALALAATAQDTADSKRRVFTSTPAPPYEVGDLWAQGASGDFMKCDVERLTGSYNSADWSKGSKYTDDTTVNNLQIGGVNLFRNTRGVVFQITAVPGGDGHEQVVMPGIIATLEANVQYTFSVKTTGTWGIAASNSNTVQAYLLKDGAYTKFYGMDTNPRTFTPDTAGEYHLRLDVNDNRYTHSFWDFQIEKGNKQTDYKPSTYDTQIQIDNITSDNVLSAAEKGGQLSLWNDAVSVKAKLNTLATTYAITTENTAYNTAFQALANYLNGGTTWSSGTPAWLASLITNTTIVGTTYRQKWNDYYAAEEALRAAINTKANALISTAQTTANTANTTANTATANIADMFNSNKATPADKVELKRRLMEIEGEYERIYEQADAIAYYLDDSFYDLGADLVNQLTTITADMSVTSTIDGTLLSTRFANYYAKRDVLIGEINTAMNIKAVAAKAEADAQAYLKEAIAQTTEINGGLLLAAALCARDAEGSVRAYLNGLQSKPYAVGAGVTGWGTGAEAAKSWLDFLGNAKFGNLRIGINGDGTCCIEDTAGVTRLEFSSKPIPALATLLAASGQDTTVSNIAKTLTVSSTWDFPNTITVVNDGSELTVAATLYVDISTPPGGNASAKGDVYLLKDGVVYANINSLFVIGVGALENSDTLTFSEKLTSVPAGIYTLRLVSTKIGSSTISVTLSASTVRAYYAIDNRSLLLGSDGMSLIWNLNQYFHMKAGAVAYRGAWDVPAGLGGASINSSGSVVSGSFWGKINATDKVVKSGNNYTITHNIGGTNYSLILTPISTNVPYFSSKSANTIVVTCAGGFDFVLIRTK